MRSAFAAAVSLALFMEGAHAEALRIAYLGQERVEAIPVSPLDEPAVDEGLAGARLGVADNATTGRFLGQEYVLEPFIIPREGDPAASIRSIAASGARLVIADLDASALLTSLDVPESHDLLFLNSRATDDELRNENCRANALHVAPSRAMLADALAQYLVASRWTRWFLVVGRDAGDEKFAAAVRRAAARFGAEIVADKAWTFQPGNARADTGHVALQTEIPAFTRGPDYDVLIVADEKNEFGEYLTGRTALPRLVAGTQGLVATSFHPVNEQWGASQLHHRFEAVAGRRMAQVDYSAWAAARAIGEAAVRTGSTDPERIAAYLRGTDFLLSGYKGQGHSFRSWDGQMRQPVLIAGPRLLISASPQAGFLHSGSELDTLGHDAEESKCRL